MNLIGNGGLTGFFQRVLFEDSIIQMEEGVLFYGNGPLTLGWGKRVKKTGRMGEKGGR